MGHERVLRVCHSIAPLPLLPVPPVPPQSSGVIVGVLLPIVGKVLYYLPSSVLASTIIISVASLIDVATAKRLWRQDKGDFSVGAMCAPQSVLLALP